MLFLAEWGLSPDVWTLIVHHPGLPLELSMSASGGLAELLGEEAAREVELIHDADWIIFPEIGEAVKAAGGEEHSMCVAIAPESGIWAVAVAAKKKNRETAAKAALICALAAEVEADVYDAFAAKWEAFAELCEFAGAVPELWSPPPGPRAPPAKRRRLLEPPTRAPHAVCPPAPPATRMPRGSIAALVPPGAAGSAGAGRGNGRREALPVQLGNNGGAGSGGSGGTTLPRDEPMWIEIPEDADVPLFLNNMANDAMVVSTDGNKSKGFYGQADRALELLLPSLGVEVGEVEELVEFQDDPNWEHFPAIGAQLKRIASAEECICVAVCRTLGVWAVGVGMKAKARYGAAKVALVGAMVVAAAEVGDDIADFAQEMPAMAEFIEDCQQSREAWLAAAGE